MIWLYYVLVNSEPLDLFGALRADIADNWHQNFLLNLFAKLLLHSQPIIFRVPLTSLIFRGQFAKVYANTFPVESELLRMNDLDFFVDVHG